MRKLIAFCTGEGRIRSIDADFRVIKLDWRKIVLVITATCAPACQTSPVLDPLPVATCACPDGVCPPSVCDLQIEVSADTCGGKVTRVQLMLGDQLDPKTWSLGVPQRTCATIPRGSALKLAARADTQWQWSETLACPALVAGDAKGPTLLRKLQCVESAAP